MRNEKKLFHELSIFSELSPEEIATISPFLTEKTFSSNELIFAQGKVLDELYIIQSGQVIIKVRLPGNYEKFAAAIEPGQIFGEIAFLDYQLTNATLIAKTEVSCLVFRREVLNTMRMVYPEVAFKIERMIARLANQKMTEYLHRLLTLLQSISIYNCILPGHGRAMLNPDANLSAIPIAELNKELLAKMPIFSHFSAEDLDILLPYTQACFLEKGYDLTRDYKQNQGTLNIICAGAMMLFIKDEKKLIKSIEVARVGEIFLNDSTDREFSQITAYVSCEPCLLLQINLTYYIQLHRVYPALFYKLSEYLHRSMVASLHLLSREFVRINSEYNDLIT